MIDSRARVLASVVRRTLASSPEGLIEKGVQVQLQMITRRLARELVEAAVAYAIEHDLPVVVAIVDSSGYLVVLERVNGAQVGAIDVAIRKASTAATFRRRTLVLEQSVLAGRTALLSLPNMMPVEGGLPIVAGEFVIGGIGVSGVASTDDEKVAMAAFEGANRRGAALGFEPARPRVYPPDDVG